MSDNVCRCYLDFRLYSIAAVCNHNHYCHPDDNSSFSSQKLGYLAIKCVTAFVLYHVTFVINSGIWRFNDTYLACCYGLVLLYTCVFASV